MTPLNAASVVSRSPEATTRATRARVLADRYPQASGPLAFYAALAEAQQTILDSNPAVVRDADPFSDAIDFERAADVIPSFVQMITPQAPAPLVNAARDLLQEGHDRWRHLLHSYWHGERGEDPKRAFIAEAMLQAFAEAVARRIGLRPDPPYTRMTDWGPQVPLKGLPDDAPGMNERVGRVPLAEVPADPPGASTGCPVCGDHPVVAVLRDQAHGARRSFLCGFCLTEWPAPRLGCPACAEEQFEKLPVYRADEFAGVRIHCCDTCRSYLKAIDLTTDATAVPVVDDIATLTLDVWAREQGYGRLRPNLLRL